jgi:hypothetical protein
MHQLMDKCAKKDSGLVFFNDHFCPRNAEDVVQLKKIKDHVKDHADEFALPVQVVVTENWDMTQVQIFLTAPDLIQGKLHEPEADGLCEEIGKALVVSQYVAAVQLACMLGTPLFLPRVGQGGTFGISESTMKSATEEILKTADSKSMWISLDGPEWYGEVNVLRHQFPNNTYTPH